MIGHMIIAKTAMVADTVLPLSTRSHTFCKASSLEIFQKFKWPEIAAISEMKTLEKRTCLLNVVLIVKVKSRNCY